MLDLARQTHSAAASPATELLVYTTVVPAGTKKALPRQSFCLPFPAHAKPVPAMTMASAATGAGGVAYSWPCGTCGDEHAAGH